MQLCSRNLRHGSLLTMTHHEVEVVLEAFDDKYYLLWNSIRSEYAP